MYARCANFDPRDGSECGAEIEPDYGDEVISEETQWVMAAFGIGVTNWRCPRCGPLDGMRCGKCGTLEENWGGALSTLLCPRCCGAA